MAIVAAAAAVATAVHPSPPPRARPTLAWLACTHLAWAAINAVICLFLASMWLLFWGQATMGIGLLACGEGCAVVTAAYKVVAVAAGVGLVLVTPFSVLLLALMMVRTKTAAAAADTDIEATKVPATDIEATKEPVPKTSDAAMRDMLHDPVTLGLLALLVFALLMLIGVLVKGDSPVMGSWRERMGSMIYDVGVLGKNAVDCFFLCPVMTVRIWRAWRKAQYAL